MFIKLFPIVLIHPQCYRRVRRAFHSVLLPFRAYQFGPDLGHWDRNIHCRASCPRYHRLRSSHQGPVSHLIPILQL